MDIFCIFTSKVQITNSLSISAVIIQSFMSMKEEVISFFEVFGL